MTSATSSTQLTFNPPATWEELDVIQGPDRLSEVGPINFGGVVRISEGVLVKYGRWEGRLAEEVLCTRFASGLSLPVPKILYHPGSAEEVVPWTIPDPNDPDADKPSGVWHICLEEVPGVPLSSIVDSMPESGLNSIGQQLREILADIKWQSSSLIGSVSGGPFRGLIVPPWCQPSRTFATIQEFLDYFRSLLAQCPAGDERAVQILEPLPTDSAICFTHGDLVPKNIMVDPVHFKITAVIDWEYAGFYPDFWEYCRMHDTSWMTPGWSKILDVVFPEPRKDAQILAVDRALSDISLWH